MCLCGEGFIVHTDDRDILFAQVGNLYVVKWEAIIGEARSYVTSQETESTYTKKEIVRAKQAYELACISGYPSVTELVNLVEDGNILNIPGITRADIKRAYELYGVPLTYVHEKMRKFRECSLVRS